MTRIVPIFCVFLLAGCQQTSMSTATRQQVVLDGVAGLTNDAIEREALAQQLTELKPGTQCTVTLAESTWENTREVSGTVASAAEGVLVLSDAEEIITGRAERGVPGISNVPYVNRLFKNVGIGVARKPLGTETFSAKQISSIRID
jgi:hypothetical protein